MYFNNFIHGPPVFSILGLVSCTFAANRPTELGRVKKADGGIKAMDIMPFIVGDSVYLGAVFGTAESTLYIFNTSVRPAVAGRLLGRGPSALAPKTLNLASAEHWVPNMKKTGGGARFEMHLNEQQQQTVNKGTARNRSCLCLYFGNAYTIVSTPAPARNKARFYGPT